jgi:3-oxoadipate enol-lactonase/4-carboxymuconolactone decarboxylase
MTDAMPLLTTSSTTTYYRFDGGDGLPVLMLSHSLGQDHSMWDAQASALSSRFRVLRYDTRGHGASAVAAGDYRIEQLATDALALADALGIRTFAFCGLSLGGMVGQWLGAHAADRVTGLILANTSPRADAQGIEERRQLVLRHGMSGISDIVMGRFFSRNVLAGNAPPIAAARRTLLATDPRGYAGCCAAIRDMDQTASLSAVRVPTLVISGELDVSLPWKGHSEILAREIPDARVIHLPTAHLSNIERPHSFSAAVVDFLAPRTPASLESGQRIRRAVLGDAHVDRAFAQTDDFTRDFQELLTRYTWGDVWNRPGLDHFTRRLLVIAMTAALGRWEEFKLHVRTGLDHEIEPCDLKEVLLQVMIYAGVPAANTAFKLAAEEMSARRHLMADDGPLLG